MNHAGLINQTAPPLPPPGWYLLHRDVFESRPAGRAITNLATLQAAVRDGRFWCIYLGETMPAAHEMRSEGFTQQYLTDTGIIAARHYCPITWELDNGLAIYLNH